MESASAFGASVIGSSFLGGLGFSGFIGVSGDGNETKFTLLASSFPLIRKQSHSSLLWCYFEKIKKDTIYGNLVD